MNGPLVAIMPQARTGILKLTAILLSTRHRCLWIHVLYDEALHCPFSNPQIHRNSSSTDSPHGEILEYFIETSLISIHTIQTKSMTFKQVGYGKA